jgi:hypothetical protein
MRKEVKDVLRGLRQYADPPSSFSMVQNNHIRVRWDMTNDDGERVTVKDTISVTATDKNWIHSHRRQLQRKFKELNISTVVTHI